MKIFKVSKENWATGVEKLTDSYGIFGPVNEGSFHNFKKINKGELPDFNFLNTRLSAKSLVHPQTEAMFAYSLDENKKDHHILKEVEKDYSPRAVIGIRPCDATAFSLVQRNFDTPQYKDPYWIRAYETFTFVGLACHKPCSTCFCTTAGCGPFHEEGLDVLLVEAGDHYLAKALTEKGENLLKTAGWDDVTDVDFAIKEIENMKQTAEAKITASVRTDQLKEKITTEIYDAPFWEEVAFSCINCGTCTYVCPTCWCFDIQDENRRKSGIRMRNWDSCMYPLFTLHGSGHNPRNNKVQRVRQRFMHKLKYYVDKYENGIQCVGCGRCVSLCPVNIDIRKVCELMNNYDPKRVCPV
jgi:formate hydrogenlyase subunit 6/NADH:ubiquinone oxidoreductase subunit I